MHPDEGAEVSIAAPRGKQDPVAPCGATGLFADGRRRESPRRRRLPTTAADVPPWAHSRGRPLSHVYRYIERTDGLPGKEGTFTFCRLWLVSSFALCGEVEQAEERLGQVLEYVNDLGLMTDEIDPVHQEVLGNVPQAFSHAGLIQANVAIEEARKAEGRVPTFAANIAAQRQEAAASEPASAPTE